MAAASGPLPQNLSAWQQLKLRQISLADALSLLLSPEGDLNVDALDSELTLRFFAEFPQQLPLPPVIPLLLWRACYYLSSPRPLTEEEIRLLCEKTHSRIQVIPISSQSYRSWFRLQNLPDHSQITESVGHIDPLTGEVENHCLTEVEDYLAQARSQAHRINAIISGALQNRASDIHLEPSPGGLRIRYRIDGILRSVTSLPQSISRAVVVAIKVMSEMNIAESRRPQDGRIGKNYLAVGQGWMDLDLRVSTLPCVGGEKVVIRLLKREQNAFGDIRSLGFTAPALEIYERWLQQPQGLIIITGPTGSGKTSTLYTSLRCVATPEVNVVTVEDPVEYVLPNITQTQVHERAGMTFAAGLRAILRQDPDIIMVGEIRDRETAETVVRAALTGHLVFTTMHTNDTCTAIPRLRDLGPDPGLLSDALLGIVAQRLVRKVCPYCAVPSQKTSEDWSILGVTPGTLPTHGWRQGKGCVKCFQSGYLGREAVVELLDIDEVIRQIVYEGSMTELQRYLSTQPFHSFRVAAIDKVVHGITTPAEIKRVLPQSALKQQSHEVLSPDSKMGLPEYSFVAP
jgi:general secretion pathway protein E/type IV pilus assembly protein PilB